MTVRYASADDFRLETNISESEWGDTALEQMIDEATDLLDVRTGRTWQGVQTVTNEYYDGTGQTFLYLNQIDVQSISALSIDDDFDGTYTDVTTSYTRIYDDIGRIELTVEIDSTIEVDSFTKGPKTVKISYTYGNATPPADVKQLCIMMVEQRVSANPERNKEIDKRFTNIKRISIEEI